MAKVPYQWALGERPPPIQQHSVAKHEILRAYLIAYIQTLISSPRQEEFRLTLIDGFAGGGVYRHASTTQEVLGSPFVMLEAVKEAEFLVNRERQKKVRLHLDYFFIENDKGAAEVLRYELCSRGYGGQLGQSIFIFQSKFQDRANEIVSFVKKKSSRRPRHISSRSIRLCRGSCLFNQHVDAKSCWWRSNPYFRR